LPAWSQEYSTDFGFSLPEIAPRDGFSALQSVRVAHFREDFANGVLNAKIKGSKPQSVLSCLASF